MCRVSNSHTSCLLTNCLQLLPVACAVFKPLVQFNSVTQLCLTLSDTMDCSMPGLPVHHQLLEFTQTHVRLVGNAIQPSYPLSSPSPPAFNPSIRVFSNKSVLPIRWPKYWSFSFSISPSNEYSGLISFTMDWLNLLAVQGLCEEPSPTPQFKISRFIFAHLFPNRFFMKAFCCCCCWEIIS